MGAWEGQWESPEPFAQLGGEARILHTKERYLLLTSSPRTQVWKLRHRGVFRLVCSYTAWAG